MSAIWIGIILGVLAVITGGLAGHLAAQKDWHKWVFWGAALVSVVLLVVQGFLMQRDIRLAEDRGRQEQAQLNRIEQKAGQPPVVNVNPTIAVSPPTMAPPVEHATLAWDMINGQPQPGPFFPFAKDEVPRINMGFTNAGNFPIVSSESHGLLLLLPFAFDQSNVYKQNLLSLMKSKKALSGTMVPHDVNHSFYTYSLDKPLSGQDVVDLNNGTKMLCGIAVTAWTDHSGKYRTSFQSCVYQQGDGSFNWHNGTVTNQEQKLR